MSQLITKYVFSVTRHLPKKDREVVSLDLIANIENSLPSNYRESDLIKIIEDFGDPKHVANSYHVGSNGALSPLVRQSFYRTFLTTFLILFLASIIGTLIWQWFDKTLILSPRFWKTIGDFTAKMFVLLITSFSTAMAIITTIFIIVDNALLKRKTPAWKLPSLKTPSPNHVDYRYEKKKLLIRFSLSIIVVAIAISLFIYLFFVKSKDIYVFNHRALYVALFPLIMSLILVIADLVIITKRRRVSSNVFIIRLMRNIFFLTTLLLLFNRNVFRDDYLTSISNSACYQNFLNFTSNFFDELITITTVIATVAASQTVLSIVKYNKSNH